MDERKAVDALLGLHEDSNISKKKKAPEVKDPGTSGDGMNIAKSKSGSSSHSRKGSKKRPADAEPSKSSKKKKKKKKERKKEEHVHSFPVQPRVVQVCTVSTTHVNHTYRDFSMVPPEPGYVDPVEISDMSFSRKLHHMLMSPEYKSIIAWRPHGRAFGILCPKKMEEDSVLKRYFGHSRFSTFLSNLKRYGMKLITKGRDSNCFYHECFLRGLPHLTKYMPKYKEGRRLLPEPNTEPDLYAISATFQVPLHMPAPPAPSPRVASNTESSSTPQNLALLQSLLGGALGNLNARSGSAAGAGPPAFAPQVVAPPQQQTTEQNGLLNTLRRLVEGQQTNSRAVSALHAPQGLSSQAGQGSKGQIIQGQANGLQAQIQALLFLQQQQPQRPSAAAPLLMQRRQPGLVPQGQPAVIPQAPQPITIPQGQGVIAPKPRPAMIVPAQLPLIPQQRKLSPSAHVQPAFPQQRKPAPIEQGRLQSSSEASQDQADSIGQSQQQNAERLLHQASLEGIPASKLVAALLERQQIQERAQENANQQLLADVVQALLRSARS